MLSLKFAQSQFETAISEVQGVNMLGAKLE
jgi:hypothetical protein